MFKQNMYNAKETFYFLIGNTSRKKTYWSGNLKTDTKTEDFMMLH